MAQAKTGDVVKVHYTGRHTNGSVFDSSAGREPLEFSLGAGMMIPGFEQAIYGMAVGDKKTITIAADDAYGQVIEEMIFPVERTQIPLDIPLEIGLPLTAQSEGGQPMTVYVKEITPDTVWLDGNHPLAGADLEFDIHVVEISDAASAAAKPFLFE